MVLSETNETTQVTTRYWHALDTLAQSDGTTTEYFAYDGLGSVRQLVDETGSVTLAQTFDAYGNGYATSGSASSRLGWTGEQIDSNGFVYLRARYYAPGMGRFTQMDPSRLENNPYLYGLSNPILNTDPGGLSAGCDADGDCVDKCGGDVACMLFCIIATSDSPPTWLHSSLIVNATVMIGLGDSDDHNTCSSPWVVSGNLGTITSRGILTHDHMISTDLLSNARNSKEAAQHIQEWSCVTITGACGSVSIPRSQIKVDLANSVQGTLMIKPIQSVTKQGVRTAIDLRGLGTPIAEDFQWKGVPGFENDLNVAIVRGPNNNGIPGNRHHLDMFLDHSNVGTVYRRMDYSRPLGPYTAEGVTHQAYRTVRRCRRNSNLQNDVEKGDSGGGVFANGKLVGVNFAREPQRKVISTIVGHYFVPIR